MPCYRQSLSRTIPTGFFVIHRLGVIGGYCEIYDVLPIKKPHVADDRWLNFKSEAVDTTSLLEAGEPRKAMLVILRPLS